MTEFDFLSVLLSIIFGLSLTHLLAGQFQLVFHRRMPETQALYSGWVFVVLVVNWWMLFSWHDYGPWTFATFMLLVLWSLSFYMLAIALYPPEEVAGAAPPSRYFWFHCAIVVSMALDIAWTAVRGTLFHPWYYLPFVLHYALLAILAELVPSPAFRRAVPAWLLVSILAWAFGVRRLL